MCYDEAMFPMHVFDTRTATGTLLPFRVPSFVARIICHFRRHLDYAPTPEGF